MSIRLKDTIYDNIDKLSTSSGGTTQPIYFKDGKPTNCTYTLGKSVPSDAKFTDTTYSTATSNTLGLVKIGYAQNNKNYPVQLSNGQMFVNVPWTDTDTNTDTKNTAGSTNSSSKLFLIGATSQAANPQTYSHDTAYVGTDGCLYSNSTKVSVEGHTHSYAASSHTHSYVGYGTVAFTPKNEELAPADVLALTGNWSLKKGTWNYSGNGYIVSDFGNIDLAGTSVLTFGTSSAYTQLYITAPTQSGHSGITNEMLFYNNHGSSYSPGWTRIITSRNYSSYCAKSSHSHNYASTVKIGSTSYSCSSNVISLPAYPTIPTIPTALKNPTSLTIQANGTSLGSYDGSSAKTFNITYSNVGAAASSHSHTTYVLKAGDVMTGPLRFERPTTSNNNYNEGARFNLGGAGSWAGFTIGNAAGSTEGNSEGAYAFLVNNKKFYIRHEDAEFLTVDTSKNILWNSGLFAIVTGQTECGVRFRVASTSGDFVGRYSSYVSLFNANNPNSEIKIHDSNNEITVGTYNQKKSIYY